MNKLFVFAPLLVLFACTNTTPPAPVAAAPAAPSHEAMIRQFFDHFNRHDWEKMAAMYSEPAIFLDPSMGTDPIPQTRAEVVAKYKEMQDVFPDIKDEIRQVYASGDKHVIVEFVSTGTAPDKSVFKLPICTVFTIENGLITKDFTYYDNSTE
jgi:steroid delta-isomerase-like uncharacterized protein